jgi:GNAT superfamily N-acetyltransferase
MIAPATSADLPAVARLMATSALLQRYAVSYEGALATLEDAVAGGDVLLIARETRLEGLAWLSFAPRMLNGAAYLRLLLARQPGHGMGSRLLAAAEAAARPLANHLYLLVTADNAGARRLYERHGFRYVGDLPGLVVAELDEALYFKTLRPLDGRLRPASA